MRQHLNLFKILKCKKKIKCKTNLEIKCDLKTFNDSFSLYQALGIFSKQATTKGLSFLSTR